MMSNVDSNLELGNGSDEDAYEVWESDEDDAFHQDVNCHDIDDTQNQNADQLQQVLAGAKIIRMISIFLLTWQVIFRISDTAIGLLIKFIKVLLSELSNFKKLNEIHEIMPDTLAKAKVMLSLNHDNFQKFIVCTKCDCTYDYNECMSTRQITKCSYVRFPRHPHVHMRARCNEPLLKNVKTTTGKKLLVPHKVYIFKSIIDSFRELFQ